MGQLQGEFGYFGSMRKSRKNRDRIILDVENSTGRMLKVWSERKAYINMKKNTLTVGREERR